MACCEIDPQPTKIAPGTIEKGAMHCCRLCAGVRFGIVRKDERTAGSVRLSATDPMRGRKSGVTGLVSFRPMRRSSAVTRAMMVGFLALIVASASVSAGVNVQGDLRAVRVVAKQAPLSEVLNALMTNLNLQYDAWISLDGVIDGTYGGAVEDVLSRVLRSYNFVIKTREGAIEVIVVGRADDRPISADPPIAIRTLVQTRPLPNTNIVTQWRIK
jgi:hypothetical protein